MSNPEVGFYIFRKDLRIKDNRGLIKLSEKVKFIIPIFIFDINQIDLLQLIYNEHFLLNIF